MRNLSGAKRDRAATSYESKEKKQVGQKARATGVCVKYSFRVFFRYYCSRTVFRLRSCVKSRKEKTGVQFSGKKVHLA